MDTKLVEIVNNGLSTIKTERSEYRPEINIKETGEISSVQNSIVEATGLPSIGFMEMVRFQDKTSGMVFDLQPDKIKIVLFNKNHSIHAGDKVFNTGRQLDIPVGKQLLGRWVDPLGSPIDNKGKIDTKERRSIEQEAPEIMDRAPVQEPLETGITLVDALIPLGRGQRELIIGDRQTGKTALALDIILNQKKNNIINIYCAIRQSASDIKGLVETLDNHDMLKKSVVVSASGDDTPGMNFIAPFAATSIAEYFMHQGEDVLIIYDDLTKHARAYRELSLLMGRPPAREAYPGDIFYLHSRLLERSTHLSDDLGGGSLTALPICETQAENISAYIPTNLISITDGQLLHSSKLFQEGILPAIEIGKSVSRVGGKTQWPAYSQVSGDLKLSYSQYKELESFSRFGTRLDKKTRDTIAHGKRVEEILKQKQNINYKAGEQLVLLLVVKENLFDSIALEDVSKAKEEIIKMVREEFSDITEEIKKGNKIDEHKKNNWLEAAKKRIKKYQREESDGTNSES